MFRIKTDIRQYKCETREKVEKLIRNWVIRPTDLIYHTDDNQWGPIGKHPAFTPLFEVLAREEQSQPDTVVTAQPDRRVNGTAPDDGLSEGSQEITNVKERPAASDADPEPAADDDDDGGPDEVTNVQPSPYEAVQQDGDGDAGPDEVTNVQPSPYTEEAANDDGDAAEASDELPEPPEPPEGVEGVSRDSDEITIMTERTLDMLRVTVEDEPPDMPPPDSQSTDGEDASDDDADPDEVTELVEREDVAGDAVADASDEPVEAKVIVDDDLQDEQADVEPVEEPQAADEERDGASDDAPDEESDHDVESDDDESDQVGRHNLPEDFFATAEISHPFSRDGKPILDELGDLERSDDGVGHRKIGENEETPKAAILRPSRWRILMDGASKSDAGAPRAAKLKGAKSDASGGKKSSAPKGKAASGRDEAKAGDQEVADEELVVAEAVDGVTSASDLPDGVPEPETPQTLGDESSAPLYAEAELEGEEGDEGLAMDDLENEESEPEIIKPHSDYVPDAYALPLPFAVHPSPDDIRLGLKRSRVSSREKDRSFPLPEPKVFKQAVRRTFDLTPTPPKDRSLVVLVVAAILVLTVIITVVATC